MGGWSGGQVEALKRVTEFEEISLLEAEQIMKQLLEAPQVWGGQRTVGKTLAKTSGYPTHLEMKLVSPILSKEHRSWSYNGMALEVQGKFQRNPGQAA